jgi:hypothetical protein
VALRLGLYDVGGGLLDLRSTLEDGGPEGLELAALELLRGVGDDAVGDCASAPT